MATGSSGPDGLTPEGSMLWSSDGSETALDGSSACAAIAVATFAAVAAVAATTLGRASDIPERSAFKH